MLLALHLRPYACVYATKIGRQLPKVFASRLPKGRVPVAARGHDDRSRPVFELVGGNVNDPAVSLQPSMAGCGVPWPRAPAAHVLPCWQAVSQKHGPQ